MIEDVNMVPESVGNRFSSMTENGTSVFIRNGSILQKLKYDFPILRVVEETLWTLGWMCNLFISCSIAFINNMGFYLKFYQKLKKVINFGFFWSVDKSNSRNQD